MTASKLHFGRLTPAEQVHRHWFADIPAGVTVDAVENPGYWLHHTRAGISALDTLTAFCEDATWEATYRVMYVGSAEIKLSRISYTAHAEGVEEPASDSHKVKWKGPVNKWSVMKKTGDDEEYIAKGFTEKSQAMKHLISHLKLVA